MPLFDSDAEALVSFGDTDITGSNSNRAAVLLAGVTPTNSASFIKVSELGDARITGSVGITQSIPLTIGAFATNVTGTVRIVQTTVTQSVTGSVFAFNNAAQRLWTTGSVSITSIASPVTVVQGASGSQFWKITGSVQTIPSGIQGVTGTIGVTSIASPVSIGNFPAVQTITGSVFIDQQPIDVTVNNVAEITGSVEITSIASPVRITGSVDFDEPVQITGSVTIGEQPIQTTGSVTVNSIASPVTVTQGSSGSLFWKVTGSVGVTSIASVVTTTGSTTVNSIASPVTVTQGLSGSQFWKVTGSAEITSVASPVTVIQGTSGSQFWKVTGSVGVTSVASPVTVIQGQSGSLAWKVTDFEEATFVAQAQDVAIGNNKSMLSIVNTGTSVVRIQEIRIVNSRTSPVAGTESIFWFVRITGHSGGTSVVPLPYDTNDSLASGITMATNATVSGEASSPLFRKLWSSDDWGAGRLDQEGLDHALQELFPQYVYRPKQKPITLRTNQGLSIKHVINSSNGTFDIQIVFTQV